MSKLKTLSYRLDEDITGSPGLNTMLSGRSGVSARISPLASISFAQRATVVCIEDMGFAVVSEGENLGIR